MRLKIVVATSVLITILWILTFKQNRFFVIQSGSMEPSFKIGDLVLVLRQSEYSTGDVITFVTRENRTVTHRIVAVENGNSFLTKGDANRTEDYLKVEKERIIGKVSQVIPKVGLLKNFCQSRNGFIVFFIMPAVVSLIEETLTFA
jgi:signal peptidase